MNNLWKRSLSLVLALVMVMGMFPVGIRAEAAADNLHLADGIIWLVKNGDDASDEFINKITGLKLDDMIREAVGETNTNAVVAYNGTNVGTYAGLYTGGEELKDDLVEAVKNHELLTFTVGGKAKQIAFRSIDGVKIVIGDNNKIIIESEGEPENLDELVANALDNPAISITHNGVGDLSKTDHIVNAVKTSYAWPEAGDGDVVAGTITVTIKADDNESVTATETAEVILRDSRDILTLEYYDRDAHFATYKIYEDEASPVVEPERNYYVFDGWSNTSNDPDTNTSRFDATWKPVNDNDGDGIANEEEVFTVTYMVGEDVYEVYPDVLWGSYTPAPADPEDTEAGTFAGWGEVAQRVYADAVYTAVFTQKQIVTVNVRYQSSTRTYRFYVDEAGKAQNPPVFGEIEPFYCTGLYYYAGDVKAAIADIKEFVFDSSITDLYIDYYTDDDGNGLEDGTAENPWYVYKFLDVNGESIKTVKKLTAGISVTDYPAYDPLNWIIKGWTISEPVVSNNGGTITYSYEPNAIADTNNNGTPDEDENDKLVLNLGAGFDVEYSAGKATVTYTDGTNTYIGTISITGLMADGSFTYDQANTEITVTPLWLNGDPATGKMLYYVNSVTVDGIDPGITYENYNAVKAKSEIATLAESEEGVDLAVTYAPATIKAAGDDGVYLAPGKASYTEQEVYEEAISTPDYDADAVTVKYLARSAGDVTVDLKNLYNSLADLIPDDYMDMAKDYVGESITVSLSEKWLEVEAAPAKERSAQAVADTFFQSVIDELKKEGFDQEVMSNKIFALKDDLKAELEANANVHKFGMVYPDDDLDTPDVIVETVDVTYETEKVYLNLVNPNVFIVDTRIPVILEVKGDKAYGYRCFAETDLLANVVAKDVEGNVISGLDLELDGAYVNAAVGSHIVGVSFAGNETYTGAQTVYFKLVVSAVAPKVSIPAHMITLINGEIDYEQHLAATVTPESAPIFQVIAGIESEELEFDSNLIIKDDEIVVKAWVKIPAMYASLINGYEYEGKTVKTGEFMYVTELEEILEDYASDSGNMGASEIKKLQSVIDMIPDRVINRLGLGDRTYTLQVRLDALEDKHGPTKPGLYVNFAASTAYLGEYLPGDAGAMFKNSNYILSDAAMDAGMVVISPMVPIPNDGGIQIYDNEISNAQNVFVYEYNGEPVDVSLNVAYNGETLADAEPFYYGVSTRLDLKNSAPTMPGVYVAGYNYFTTVINPDTNEEEIHRYGSDSCVIIIKQREIDMSVTGGIYEYDEDQARLPVITVTDKNGNEVNDAAMVVVSGTVNVDTNGTNVTANDLYGAINIDFPDSLTIPALELGDNAVFTRLEDAWNYYRSVILNKGEDAAIRPSDFVAFLRFCSEKAVNGTNKAMDKFQAMGIGETIDSALAKLGDVPVTVDGSVKYAQNVLNSGKAYFDKLLDELDGIETLDDNAYITFYDLEDDTDKLNYHRTGAYLHMAVTVDPDMTVAAGAAVIIIHSADDYIMYDTHVPYDANPHTIFTVDETEREEVTVVMDRADDSFVAVSADGKEIHFHVDAELAQVLVDEFNQICNTEYTVNSGAYVGTVYEKTGNFAERVTNKIMASVKARGEAEIAKRYEPASELYVKAIDKLTAKLLNLETKVLNKLQELDTLENGTKICINAVLPVDLGTYEITTFDFNVNEINIILDNDAFSAINAALTKAGLSTISEGGDTYVVTGYEKAEEVAEIITNEVISRLKAYGSMAIYKIDNMIPEDFEELTPDQLMALIPDELKDLTADTVNAATQEKLDALNAKLLVYEARLLDKLQSIDNLDNDTRIVLNGQLPVEVGTYDFFGFDYDVSATRGVLVIEPIYVAVDDNANSKYYGEEDPELTATVTYYSYSGNTNDGITKVEITTLPNDMTESKLVSYNVVRAEGEDAGLYDMSVTDLKLLDTTGRYVLAEHVEDDQDFEIYPELGTIKIGEWTMSLDEVIKLNNYPALVGWSENYDLEKLGGVVIWTGDAAPTSAGQLTIGAENTITLEGMYYNEQKDAYFVKTDEIFAKNIGDIVYIRIYVKAASDPENKVVYSNVKGYSPALFCYDVMNDTTEPENKKQTCGALLEYGASAQIYFDYDTKNMVNVVPSDWPVAAEKLAEYTDTTNEDHALKYDDSYLTDLYVPDNAPDLVKTMTGSKNDAVIKGKQTLDLQGAIRMNVGFDLDASVIDWNNVEYAKVMFWSQEKIMSTTDLSIEGKTYDAICDLTVAENGVVDLGDYVAASHHIKAKNLGDSVYYYCAIKLYDSDEVYRSSLIVYSPEMCVKDHLTDTKVGQVDEVCRRIAVYSEKARVLFGWNLNEN